MRAWFQPNIRKLGIFEGRRRLLVLFSKVITNLCQTIFSSSEVVFELSDDGVVLDILFTAVWLFGSSLTLWRQRHPYMGDRQISWGTRAKLAKMSPGTRLFHSWKLISILQNVLFGLKPNVLRGVTKLDNLWNISKVQRFGGTNLKNVSFLKQKHTATILVWIVFGWHF